jgi:hypothetical protein
MVQWLQDHRTVWEFVFQLLTVVGTVGAVFVALWLALRVDWVERRNRPCCGWGSNSARLIAASTNREGVWRGRSGGFLSGTTIEREVVRDAYWFRMFVQNDGQSPAHDVEIMLSDVFVRPAPAKPYEPYDRFLLSDAVWTHGGDVMPQLLPRSRRLFDVGSIVKPLGGSGGDETHFKFRSQRYQNRATKWSHRAITNSPSRSARATPSHNPS